MDDNQQPKFRIIPGLPPYGPLPKSFPISWGKRGQEGLVVEFTLGASDPWVGNFGGGPGGASRVLHHPDLRRVLVLSSGDLWVVDVANQTAEELETGVDEIWQVPGASDVVLSRQGLAFLRLAPTRTVWHTRRLSWDGFSEVVLTDESIHGLAWSPIDSYWHPFSVDMLTGKSSGGSFGDTDAEHWERFGG